MLTKTLHSICSKLEEHSIPYMVIGGYAVLYYGEFRLTEDIDIVLGIDTDSLDNVLQVVKAEFKPRTEKTVQFVHQTNVLPLLFKESNTKVDLIFSFIPFEREAIKRAVTVDIKGKNISIIGVQDLVIYKLIAGRAKDLEDVKNIINYNYDEINPQQIEKHVAEISELMGNDLLVEKWNELKQKLE